MVLHRNVRCVSSSSKGVIGTPYLTTIHHVQPAPRIRRIQRLTCDGYSPHRQVTPSKAVSAKIREHSNRFRDCLHPRILLPCLIIARCRANVATWHPFSQHQLAPYATHDITTVGEAAPSPDRYRVSTQELRDLVDFYSTDEALENCRSNGSGSLREDAAGKHNADQDATYAEEEALPPRDDEVIAIVQALERLLEDEESNHERLFELYSSLPQPRVDQMPRRLLDKMLNHLCIVEYPSEPSMLRYLSVIEDVKASGRKIRLHHWNSVIHFAGKCFKKVSERHVNLALDTWREMEKHAGVKANHVTFNILFDIATKSGKFLLADMVYEEMKTRDLPYTRFFRTSLIYHQGLRHDGDGVRKAYTDLIDAGEVVDTAVINSVIAAFIQCGEATAAEHTFERIKRLHASKTDKTLPPSGWRDKRKMGRHLEKASAIRRYRKSKQVLEGPFSPNMPPTEPKEAPRSETPHQDVIDGLLSDDLDDTEDQTSVAPDLTTFKLLIHYHAVTAGDIDHVANLVDEMEHYNVALHGSIFMYLFKAFAIHGGIVYTQWTYRRLNSTWTSYLKAVDADDGAGLVYTSQAAAGFVTRAFLKCAGVGRATEVYAEMRTRIEFEVDEQVHDLDQEMADVLKDDVQLFWDLLELRTKQYIQKQEREEAKRAEAADLQAYKESLEDLGKVETWSENVAEDSSLETQDHRK